MLQRLNLGLSTSNELVSELGMLLTNERQSPNSMTVDCAGTYSAVHIWRLIRDGVSVMFLI
jgi:hypothetical protein